MPKQEKLPPGPYYEPVTSWREITFWLVGIASSWSARRSPSST